MEMLLENLKIKRGDKYSLLLIGAALLCLLLKFYAIDPLREETAAKEAQLAAEKQRLADYLAFAEEHSDYDAFLTEQAQAVQAAQNLLPGKITAPEFIKSISALAQKHRLQVISIKPLAAAKKAQGAYTSITLQVSLQGSFYKAADFLAELQTQQAVSTANLTLEYAGEKAYGGVVLRADFTAYSFDK